MKLGANSVLFGGYDMETAFKYLAMAGYDGIEVSAISGMSEHLVLADWRAIAPEIRRLSKEYDLELLAMEQPSQDEEIMDTAFQAAAETGIPIINCGPGGTSGDEDSLQTSIDSLGRLADRAENYGVTALRQGPRGRQYFRYANYAAGHGSHLLACVRNRHGSLPYPPRRREPRGRHQGGASSRSPRPHPRLQGPSGRSRRAGGPGQRPRRYRPGGLCTGPARRRVRRPTEPRGHRRQGVFA